MIYALGFAMAAHFKPDGKGGWLYRRDRIGPPLPATTAERNGYVRWFGWMLVMGAVLAFAAMIGLAFVADAIMPDPTDNQGVIGAIVMAAIVFGGLHLFLKVCTRAPARAFADRTPVGPAQNRKRAYGRQLARQSYGRMALYIGALIVASIGSLWDRPDAWWLAIGLPLVVGLACAYWKWSVEREPG